MEKKIMYEVKCTSGFCLLGKIKAVKYRYNLLNLEITGNNPRNILDRINKYSLINIFNLN